MKKFRMFEGLCDVEIDKVCRPSVYNIDGRINVETHIALCGTYRVEENATMTVFFAQKLNRDWVVFSQEMGSSIIMVDFVKHDARLADCSLCAYNETWLDEVDQYIIYEACTIGGFAYELDKISDEVLRDFDNPDIPIYDAFVGALSSYQLDWNSDADKAIEILYNKKR